MESVAEAIETGSTLPASWYADPAVLVLERERIFARYWQYVGRVEQVGEPGDFFASRAGHIPVLVVRTHTGLNAFVNVCRHRGHLVALGCGRRETLQCPYHAWTYDLDGNLRAAPRSEREAGFNKEDFSLLPMQVDVWGPFVFVNADLEAPPLAEALGEIPVHVASSGLDLDSLSFRDHYEWELRANWKLGLENFLECYHCPVAHPSFSDLIDVDQDSYVLSSSGLVSSQFGPVRPAAFDGNRRRPYDPSGEIAEAQYHLLWPNFTINVNPGPPNISVNTWSPVDVGLTRGTSDYFFGPDVPDELMEEMRRFDREVGAQDESLVESVQAGLASGMIPRGRLLLGSEHLIQHFQRLVATALAG
jgi:phenylpropionate dioxygenase-like ring-hydroxylating dioxygenase large terminal subunit